MRASYAGQMGEKEEKWLNSKSNEDREEYFRVNRGTTRTLRKKKREYLKGLLEKAERDQRAQNTRDFYKCVRHFRRGYTPNAFGIKDKEGNILVQKQEVTNRWREHFEELLNGEEIDNNEEIPIYHDVQPLVENPTIEEVEQALNSLKDYKSPGEDGMVAELFKKGGRTPLEKLHDIICRVWNEEKMPKTWKESIIVPIYKKGDKGTCGNYRGISLLSHGYKVLSKIIQKRLEEYTSSIIEDHQAGFVKGRSTTDQIHILKQVISKHWEYNKEVHGLFIDFSKAYDSLDRRRVFQQMEMFGIPRKLIKLVEMTLNESKCKVKIDGELSESFEVRTGVRQGDGLSPILFNIALEDALQQVRQTNIGLKMGTKINILAFADDVVILSKNRNDLEELTRLFIQKTEKMGLKINDEKTKYMHFTRQPNEMRANEIIIDGHNFEVVEQFKYLGVVISSSNSEEMEINYRIAQANKCMYTCKKLLTSKILSHRTKIKIYHTVIRPVLTYGAETWILNKKEEHKMIVFENKMLRMIYGPTQENGEWRKRHNREIRNMYNDYDVVAHVKARRIRWAGHTLRREQGSLLKEASIGKPEGKRPLGRPKKRWWDSVSKDVREVGAAVEEAEDRERWRAVVGAAKSRLGHKWPWE